MALLGAAAQTDGLDGFPSIYPPVRPASRSSRRRQLLVIGGDMHWDITWPMLVQRLAR